MQENCRKADSNKIWKQCKGGSDLAPLIPPSCLQEFRTDRGFGKIVLSCNLANCKDMWIIYFFLFSKLAEVRMDDQEEKMKNKKYTNLKIFPSDIT